ncbi:MAG: NAD-dependent epimerase/dehydratase family protein [Solirubrobacteraceae bacterium]
MRVLIAGATGVLGQGIVHELTALPGMLNMRHFDCDLAATNRLRTEATDHLLAAGRAVDVRRFVAQSFAGWPFARVGGPGKTEEDPLDLTPAAGMRETLAALRHLEDAVLGAEWTEGVVLRYGNVYGPGTAFEPGRGAQAEMIRKRKLPLVGAGTGVWSFVDVNDAADATVTAVSTGPRGIYNIVDDDPAPVAEWLSVVARSLGAGSPRRVPGWLARLIAGKPALVAMTEARGASKAKAKRDLRWQPSKPSWRGNLGRVDDL